MAEKQSEELERDQDILQEIASMVDKKTKKEKTLAVKSNIPTVQAQDADDEKSEAGEISIDAEEETTSTASKEDSRIKWYVVHTYSGYENKVKVNLDRRIASLNMQDKIFQVLVPTEEEVEFKDGKKKTVQRKIYPGYVLVKMIMTDDSWYVVRNTSGVTGFVGPGIKPVPLPDDEVKKILRIMGFEAPLKVKHDLQMGQPVKVIHGPFKEFHGVVEEVSSEREKIRVLISFLGRETPVELDFGQIEKI